MDKHYCSYMLINDQLASPRKFFKWCNLVRFAFGTYFHKNFTLKKSRHIHFIHKHRGAKQGGVGGSQPPLNFGWGG